ncbi:MAG: organic hydroperoxide resistance protein [Alphaproteobacteria bacterium]|nr:organic hydroperoxide resistance protein [Alphaproteobacteria bacterium]MCD8570888.1 organic hydroperoxide resistance protein [Alphaproteobacteria bacterium]
MTILATEQASATAGREGTASSKDGKINLKLSPPGSNGPGTNPEQLFAAGYSACFGQAIKAMAGQHKVSIDPNAVEVEATVQLHKDDAKGFFISVTLNATIPGADQADAEKLVEAAHQICPYSKATRGNVDVSLQANGTALKAAA